MGFSNQMSSQYLIPFSKHWAWFLVWGIALAALGIFAVSATALTTLVTVFLLAFVLIISGIVLIIDAFSFWHGKGRGFPLHVIMGILYLVAGAILIKNPVAGSVSITFLLGTFYILLGIFRIIYSLSMQLFNWGWSLINGIITLLLGVLIMESWPESSLYIIGLFVGIDLFFCGWAYIMVAFAARRFLKNPK